jgi:hypothetical protein
MPYSDNASGTVNHKANTNVPVYILDILLLINS